MPDDQAAHAPRVVASGSLSRETAYSINVIGLFGVKEAERLVSIAELLRDWLREDESRAEAEITP